MSESTKNQPDNLPPLTASADLANAESLAHACARQLVALRAQLADGRFLREKIYSIDHSRFLGSTYRYLVDVELESKEQARKRLVEHVPAIGLSEKYASSPSGVYAGKLIDGLAHRLPRRVCTLYELPQDTPAHTSVQRCLLEGEQAIGRSLVAKIPFAWFCAKLRGYCRFVDFIPPRFDHAQTRALLANMHDLSMNKARTRFPEVWDTARGWLVLDSRGVEFGYRLVEQLIAAGELQQGHRFVDIGSGIGTVVNCVAVACEAQVCGVELHEGLHRFARRESKRLVEHGVLQPSSIQWICGDAFQPATVDLSHFHCLYVYSPLWPAQFDLDPIVARMMPGSLLISAQLPVENLGLVRLEPSLAGMFAMRKKHNLTGEK
ncbi:MAG: class I SAM-dependent methyltransferase [Planctomycetales bacterium]|nr:class I SAM-dependent methyltransferase [Planctomycetales bacterium]